MRNGQHSLRELTTARAAEIALGVSTEGLQRLINDGHIAPAGCFGSCLIFWLDEVEDLAERTAEKFMSAIEAAHAAAMQPSEFADLASKHGVPWRAMRGSMGYSDRDVNDLCDRLGIPFRTEPDDTAAKNKYRQQARMVAARARRSGRLIAKPCAVCGEEKVHGHHDDYTKPLDVIWLCSRCHGAAHTKQPPLTT